MKLSHNIQKTLTDKQQLVAVSSNYPQYLQAGAGTGKTEVLIQKIINILNNEPNVSLDNFGIITFTNKATEEMRTRLSNGLYKQWFIAHLDSDGQAERVRKQVEITSMVDICTIHSFCERLLRRNALMLGIPLNFKVKSFRYESGRIINRIVSQYYDDEILRDIPQYKLTKLIDIFLSECSNRGIPINDELLQGFAFSTPENAYWNSFKQLYIKIIAESFNEIEAEKLRNGVLAINDLIRHSVLLLKNDYIASKIATHYQYLFIDEFQDTNRDQFEFVKQLIERGVKVFLVGDNKQSVYSFRGANVINSEAMREYIYSKQLHSQPQILDENFRSDASLIDAINRIFKYDFEHKGNKIRFPIEPLAIPKIKLGSGLDDCVEICFSEPVHEIIERIMGNEINGRKVSYGDIAILCRRNYDLDQIGRKLKELGYPVEIVGGRGFYQAKEIVDTYKLFNAVLTNGSEQYNELIFTDYYAAIAHNSYNGSFEEFFERISAAFRFETVERLLTYVFEEAELLDYYASFNNHQAISNLLKLRDISRTLMDKDNIQPLQFLDYLRIMISTKQEDDEAEIPEQKREKGVIKLFSIHKAKGLSFPVVIMPFIDNRLNRPITNPKIIIKSETEPPIMGIDCNIISSDLPHDKDYLACVEQKNTEHLEEELRVFYVACTRAKNKLILSAQKPYLKVKETLAWDNYASVAKWLLQVENGEFVEQYISQTST